jgi:hypothetical protein
MTDVRLVATDTDTGSLVPVASNASGQLAVQSPKIEKVPNDFDVEGDLKVTGLAEFVGVGKQQWRLRPTLDDDSGGYAIRLLSSIGKTHFEVNGDGSAEFVGDVTVGSRNKSWMLVEQGGLCHMVEQTRISTGDLVNTTDLVNTASVDNPYPKLRDVFQELNLIEEALSEVMSILRLSPPAGWPVWDGSDETQ